MGEAINLVNNFKVENVIFNCGEYKVLDQDNNIPNIDKFLSKYKKYLNDDFVMGYYIHLYTDYLWFKYFITEIYEKNIITKKDGELIKCYGNMLDMYI